MSRYQEGKISSNHNIYIFSYKGGIVMYDFEKIFDEMKVFFEKVGEKKQLFILESLKVINEKNYERMVNDMEEYVLNTRDNESLEFLRELYMEEQYKIEAMEELYELEQEELEKEFYGGSVRPYTHIEEYNGYYRNDNFYSENHGRIEFV